MVDAHDNETYTAQDSRLIWIDCEMDRPGHLP